MITFRSDGTVDGDAGEQANTMPVPHRQPSDGRCTGKEPRRPTAFAGSFESSSRQSAALIMARTGW